MDEAREKNFENRVDSLYRKLGVPVPVHKEYNRVEPLEMTEGQSLETLSAVEKLTSEKLLTPEEKILVSDFSDYLAQHGHNLIRDLEAQDQLVAYDKAIVLGNENTLQHLSMHTAAEPEVISSFARLFAIDRTLLELSSGKLENIKSSINVNLKDQQLVLEASKKLTQLEAIARSNERFGAMSFPINRSVAISPVSPKRTSEINRSVEDDRSAKRAKPNSIR